MEVWEKAKKLHYHEAAGIFKERDEKRTFSNGQGEAHLIENWPLRARSSVG
jgi:hypothetical protein